MTNQSIIQKAIDKIGIEKVSEALTKAGISAEELSHNWALLAREEQLAPKSFRDKEKSMWLYRAGRGAGKTRSGAEQVRIWIEEEDVRRIHFIAPTAGDARDTMIEGVSGFLSIYPEDNVPLYEPSKRQIVVDIETVSYAGMTTKRAGKCFIKIFSSERPDRLRGTQCEKLWGDEIAFWVKLQDTYDNAMFGLRLGDFPQAIFTSTPRPIKLIKELCEDENVVVTKGTTYDNRANLAPAFYKYIIKKYEGTRLGRQELLGKILDDNPDALFKRNLFDKYRVEADPLMIAKDLVIIVIPVDPAVTSTDRADDTGIIPCGVMDIDGTEHYYILGDYTVHTSPDNWIRESIIAYDHFHADKVVAEVNNGGDLVEALLRKITWEEGEHTRGEDIPYEDVRATRGKRIRAEPVSMLQEQGRLHLVGHYPELEDECCEWSPGSDSPNRLDSMVWGITCLMNESTAGVRWI